MEEQENYEETPEQPTDTSGGEETPQFDAEEFERLRAENEALRNSEQSMAVMLDPNADLTAKKNAARTVLLAQGYDPSHVEEWVGVYDEIDNYQEAPEEDNSMEDNSLDLDFEDPQARAKAAELESALNQMRARNLKESMEKQISSAMDSNNDLKILKEWMSSTRNGEDLSPVFSTLSENVRQNALENLRKRRDAEGRFDESWLDDAVNTAATKIAKDMLTVIGDPSKIGRVPETAGQTETLSRRKPVELPDTKGKSFGDVEGQLRDWTTDQILRSLADPGGDSKA